MKLLLAGSVLDPLYDAFGAVLAAYYGIVKSYGVAIALLTITLRVLLIPLTAKQVRSQQAMSKLQPEMKRLQTKYKGDRQKLNEEMMALYKEHGANPISGCLPVLLQMPLFIVLYRLILDLSHKVDGKAMPKHLPSGSEMRESLVESGGRMVSWGFDLAEKAGSVPGGLGKALPYYVLVALVVATGYYQQRQMSARTPKDSVNPQMQMVMKIFPVMFGLISLSVPAGVVVYFIVSNLWQIGQQAVTFRTNPPVHLSAGESKSSADPGSKAAKSKSSKSEATGSSKGPQSAKGTAKGTQSSKGAQSRNGRPGPGSKSSTEASASNPKAKKGGPRPGPSRSPAPRKPSGRAQPKKVRPDAVGRGARPAPSPRPKGLPGPSVGSSNGQAESAPRGPFWRGRKGT